MALSSWLCRNSTKNMFVKIVHPGGYAEVHERPVLAAEIMVRNPRCCVTYPHVFKQPWAIVTPDTMLMPGQKFYVVPISTIRRLQQRSRKQFASPMQKDGTGLNRRDEKDGIVCACWLFVKKNTPKLPHTCLKQSEESKPVAASTKTMKEREKDCHPDDNCFMCLVTRIKLNPSRENSSDDPRRSPSTVGSSESKELNGKRTMLFARTGIYGSPKRLTSFEHWQPSLKCITEEHND